MTNISRHAITIPPNQIQHAGEPVFPVLRQHIRGNVRLNELIDARERYGLAKYHQPLLTDDGRDTHTEICNEAADLLAYTTKLAMQRNTALTWDLVSVCIEFVDGVVAAVEDIELQEAQKGMQKGGN